MSYKLLGETIKTARTAGGLTQRQLADILAVDYTYISKIENGKIDGISDTTLASLATTLNLDFNQLLRLKLGARFEHYHLDDLEFIRSSELVCQNQSMKLELESLKAKNQKLEQEVNKLKEILRSFKRLLSQVEDR